MAAGLGFKTFVTGEVLTAGDTNGYLMQGINVFASTAARDAAITSPQEGQFAFTKDTNGLWYYDGAAWVASGATGDIEGVTAGIGISGGGTSGTVTVTNSMATAIDAKGDLVAGTAADTFSRLAVGANDTVLTADSAQATGLKWAVSAGATNWTLLNTGGTALTAATTITVSALSAKEMLILIDGASAGAGDTFTLRFNSDTAANYSNFGLIGNPQSTYFATILRGVSDYSSATSVKLGALANNTGSSMDGAIFVDLTDKTGNHMFDVKTGVNDGGSNDHYQYNSKGIYEGSAVITSVSIISNGSNFDAGTIYIWGAN